MFNHAVVGAVVEAGDDEADVEVVARRWKLIKLNRCLVIVG